MKSNSSEEVSAVAARTLPAPREVLTPRQGGVLCGIDILRVQEIRSCERPTRIAGAPPHVLGVTNQRGVIVPIVDLRCCFGLDASSNTDTVTVVLRIGGRIVGAMVDSVSDVFALLAEQVKPAPEFNGTVHAGHIPGIATLGDGRMRMLILLDIQQVMTRESFGLIEPALQ